MKDEIVLAFDVGLKRTGIASGQTLTRTATPAGRLAVKNGQFEWTEVDRLISRWEPDRIAIGDPKTADPHLKKVINRLKSHIQQHHKLPIVDVDETLTSALVSSDLAHSGLGIADKTAIRDQLAACLILEGYFASLSRA